MKTNLIFAAIVLVARTAIAQPPAWVAQPHYWVPEINPTPDQIVRVQQLPSVAAIANAAESQGVAIRQIFLTSGQVTVVYKYNDWKDYDPLLPASPRRGAPPLTRSHGPIVPPLPAVAPGNSGRCPCFADCGLRSAGVRLRFRLTIPGFGRRPLAPAMVRITIGATIMGALTARATIVALPIVTAIPAGASAAGAETRRCGLMRSFSFPSKITIKKTAFVAMPHLKGSDCPTCILSAATPLLSNTRSTCCR